VNPVAQVFAGVAVLVHLLAFFWEVVVFRRPGVHEGIFRIPTRDLPAALLWAVNVGFYNLCLAAGPVIGLIALHTGNEPVGRALILYACGYMTLCGIVLAISDLLALSRPRGAGRLGAIAQTAPPLIALVAAAF
jgi:putative membrane protein